MVHRGLPIATAAVIMVAALAGPAQDAPYLERVALRWTYRANATATWPSTTLGPFQAATSLGADYLLFGEGSIAAVRDASAFAPVEGNWTFSSQASVVDVTPTSGFTCSGRLSAASTAGPAGAGFAVCAGTKTVAVVQCPTTGEAPCTVVTTIPLPAPSRDVDVAVLASGAVTVFVATETGVHEFNATLPTQGSGSRAVEISHQTYLNGTNATTIAWHAATSTLAVGSTDRMWFQDRAAGLFNGSFPWRDDWVSFPPFIGATVDNVPTAMAWADDGTLWIGNQDVLNSRDPDTAYHRFDGVGGLPWANISSVAAATYSAVRSSGGAAMVPAPAPARAVWLGSNRGVVLRMEGDEFPFRFLAGPRYLPPGAVLSVAAAPDGGSALALTESGFSVLVLSAWTLRDKAAHMEALLARHDRHGLSSDCALAGGFGDGRTLHCTTSDNDGLWTSINAAALFLKFAATGDAADLVPAKRRLAAVEFLHAVTGAPWFVARSVVLANETRGGGEWANSTAFPGWVYKRDTSSDEIVGHALLYAAAAATAADAAPQAVAEATATLDAVIGGIVNHSWCLIDPVTSKPTTWGTWNPARVNGDRTYADNRGLQSLQILAFLAAAERVVPDRAAFYADAASSLLAHPNNYGHNAVNAKIELPSDDNFSDDELAFLPYYTHLALADPKHTTPAAASVAESLRRTWNVVAPERPDLWTFIYVASGVDPTTDHSAAVEAALVNLRNWPLELINWPVQNSDRHDVVLKPYKTRFNTHQSRTVLPANERVQLRWNGNPYILDGGSGTSECDPGAFLLPYWIARAHGILDAPTQNA